MTEKKKQKLEVLSSEDKDDETVCTFVLNDEDHTLGNALRYIIMKNPDVEFCGYSVPHPTENNIHLRIQTLQNTTAQDVLKKGLKDLSDVCSHVLVTFKTEVANYKDSHPEAADDAS